MHMLVEQDKKTSAKTKQAQHQSKHASKPLTASAGGGETGSMYVLSYEVRWYVHI